MRQRSLHGSLLGLVGMLLVARVGAAQSMPGYTFRAGSGTAVAGDVVGIPILLDNTTANPVEGWAMSVQHDPGELALVSTSLGSAAQTVLNGGPPAGVFFQTYADGWTVAVLICWGGCSPLPPGVGQELVVATYSVLPTYDGTTQVCPCSCLGSPPIRDEVLVALTELPALVQCGTISATTAPAFVRADCNHDASADLADAVLILGALYVPGTALPPCLDACDANDDDALDIADAVFLLNYLFVALSLPPPAPYPSCGSDPMSAGLPCPVSTACP
ncbi:MAG: hypothetical protein AB7O52_04180 [Planctomycetota bacterium]